MAGRNKVRHEVQIVHGFSHTVTCQDAGTRPTCDLPVIDNVLASKHAHVLQPMLAAQCTHAIVVLSGRPLSVDHFEQKSNTNDSSARCMAAMVSYTLVREYALHVLHICVLLMSSFKIVLKTGLGELLMLA